MDSNVDKKKQIIDKCTKSINDLNIIIDNINDVDSSESRIARLSRNKLVFTLFELMDRMSDTEIEIYNYLKGGR